MAVNFSYDDIVVKKSKYFFSCSLSAN